MRYVICIDLKGFFASCECVERGLDPFKTPLLVANEEASGSAIVLAISPGAKRLGIKSRCRLRDIPKNLDVIIAKPKMKMYFEKSMEIINIYLSYFSQDDMFVYSIDEVFIDVTPYLKMYDSTPQKIAKAILQKVVQTTKIPASVGIGDNFLLAKLALDIEAKNNVNNMAYWTVNDVESKLWNVPELSMIWGIGKGLSNKLNSLGIDTVKKLAKTDVELLVKQFGVVGYKLHDLANGKSDLIISEDISAHIPKSIGKGQTTTHDVDSHNVPLLLREMLEEVIFKLKLKNFVARKIHVYVGYSYVIDIPSLSKSMTLEFPTDDLHVFLRIMDTVLNSSLEQGYVRKLSVSISMLEEKRHIQLNLFDDYNVNYRLDDAIVNLKESFGNCSVLYATALLDESSKLKRSKLIGGHNGK